MYGACHHHRVECLSPSLAVSRRLSPLFLALLIAIVAQSCDNAVERDTTLAANSVASSKDDIEDATINYLARVVALALDDPSVRNEVRRNLADSRYTPEHKIHFQRHLRTQSEGNPGDSKLFREMIRAAGVDGDSLLRMADSVLDLEFYMPDPVHRSNWAGGAGIQVAWLLDEEEAPIAYSTDGSMSRLSTAQAPTTPILVLVPVETNFETPLPAGLHNAEDAGGASIGTWQRSAISVSKSGQGSDASSGFAPEICYDAEGNPYWCPSTGGGTGTGGGGSSSPEPGLYYTASNLGGVGEAWAKGDPEIEIHVLRITPQNNGTVVGESLCRAGQYEERFSGESLFDQNNEQWSGRVKIVDESFFVESAGTSGSASQGYSIAFWEDDNVPCGLVDNGSYLEYLLNATVGGPALVGIGVLLLSAPDITLAAQAVGVSLVYWGYEIFVDNLFGIWRTNDDLLGSVRFGPGSNPSVVLPGLNNYTLVKEIFRNGVTSNNGTVQIDLVLPDDS